jgi:uncharacterized hydrophobic protein (TIGR00271 family)
MRKKIFRFLDLTSDLDDIDQIHTSIENGIIFKGTNLWILIFATVIASVGLNTNSTAVIIGAMLISPLMGPINGMGYSIATYDFELFQRALKNFAFAVAASLLASTVYFSISPLSRAHSELLARTSPTIYDVLIAMFGGLAGIVAISSRHKGTVIAGVAIATALMPPLCTAGYGLATLQFSYFFGAFYLFVINTVFIGISSVLFSQVLNFPIRTIVEPRRKRQVNHIISVIIAVTLIPSIYFGYVLIQKEQFIERANTFVNLVTVIKGSYLLKHEIDPDQETIKLVYAGMNLSEGTKTEVLALARATRVSPSNVTFEQAISFNEVNADISEVDNNLRAELNRLSLILQSNRKEIDSLQNRTLIGKQLLTEVQSFYPQIRSLTFSETTAYQQGDSTNISLVVLTSSSAFKNSDKQRIQSWIKSRIAADSVKTIFNRE